MMYGVGMISPTQIGSYDTTPQTEVGVKSYGACFVDSTTTFSSTAGGYAYTAGGPTPATVGDTVTRYDGNLYIYLLANTSASGTADLNAAIAVGNVVTFDQNGNVTALATTSTAAGSQVAIATAAIPSGVAAGYAWYLLEGTGIVSVLGISGGITAIRLQTSATAGVMANTTTASKYINLGWCDTTATSATGTSVSYPVLGHVSFPIANMAA